MHSPNSHFLAGVPSQPQALDEAVDEQVVRDLLVAGMSKNESVRVPAEKQVLELQKQSGFATFLLVRLLQINPSCFAQSIPIDSSSRQQNLFDCSLSNTHKHTALFGPQCLNCLAIRLSSASRLTYLSLGPQ
jgi:hypothetical protein